MDTYIIDTCIVDMSKLHFIMAACIIDAEVEKEGHTA